MATPSQKPLDPAAGVTHHVRWWRRVFEDAEDAHLLCQNGYATQYNRSARRLLQVPPTDEAEPRPLRTFFELPIARQLAAISSGVGRSEAFPATPVLLGGHPAFLADLQVIHLDENHSVVILKDTSRLQRLEAHTRRLVAAIDATPDVVFLTNPEFRLTYVNPAFQDVTGYSIEESLGRPHDFLRLPSEVDKVAAYLATARSGRDWRGELLNLRRDGSVYAVEAVISPICDRDGTSLGFAAFERDLTVRKQLEAELRLERNLVRSILNSLDAAVYTLDRDFRLIHLNDAALRFPRRHGGLVLEQPPKPGQPLLDAVPDGAQRTRLRELFESVVTTNEAREIRMADEGRHWLVNLVPWHHENRVSGLIYRISDLTEMQQLQSQLYQAQKMETVGALASGVAHDFNNLLMAIRGNVTLLLMEDGVTEENRQRLTSIDRAAERAAEITRQLLSFSRASEEQITTLDFNQVIKEASELSRRMLRHQVELHLQPAPAALKVRIDATRAQQMLLNLCVNAFDAMPEGGTVTLTNALVQLTAPQAARAHKPEGARFVRCSVSDTGPGIPAEVLPRIFDPFFTTKAKGKGTGLGLAIVHSVTDQAGGFVEVDTAPGRGTTFHLYLPEVGGHVTATAASVVRPLQGGHGRILLVDDMDLVLDFTQKFLRAAGYEVLTATGGLEALEILERDTPVDLLLTDHSMPGMSGHQLIEAVAARWPHLKIILATGYLEPAERDHLERTYRARILHKPFNLAEAAELIAGLLRK
jgi:two-component system, cell cycle sensor histidine kinase and response regulator CckA